MLCYIYWYQLTWKHFPSLCPDLINHKRKALNVLIWSLYSMSAILDYDFCIMQWKNQNRHSCYLMNLIFFSKKKGKKGRLSAIFFSQYVYIQILKMINTPLGISCILPAPTRKSDNINHFTVSCQLGEERKKKNTHPNLVYTARNSLLLTRLPKCSGPRLNSSWLSLIFNLQTSFSITTVYSDMNTNGLD